MKNIILSWKYFIYVLITIIYTSLTYFTFDYNCMRQGVGGFCGVITAILNAPAIAFAFPLFLILDIFAPGTNQPASIIYLILYWLTLIVGWSVLGILVGWVIHRSKKPKIYTFNSANSVTTNQDIHGEQKSVFDKSIPILYWIGIVSIFGGAFSGGIAFLAIPITLITIPVFIIRMTQAFKAKNNSRALKYLFLVLFPFITLGVVIFYTSYIQVGGY